jgi:nucleotide-binding universal stress UspA family protein
LHPVKFRLVTRSLTDACEQIIVLFAPARDWDQSMKGATMDFERILCPIDFSDFNDTANQYASVLAEASGAKIIYLHVAPADAFLTSDDPSTETDEESKLLEQLQSMRPTTDGITAEYVVKYGSPNNVIADYANDNQIDLIVLGTHGRTGFRRVIMGSIAESVVRNADCPVLAIKTTADVTNIQI